MADHQWRYDLIWCLMNFMRWQLLQLNCFTDDETPEARLFTCYDAKGFLLCLSLLNQAVQLNVYVPVLGQGVDTQQL